MYKYTKILAVLAFHFIQSPLRSRFILVKLQGNHNILNVSEYMILQPRSLYLSNKHKL